MATNAGSFMYIMRSRAISNVLGFSPNVLSVLSVAHAPQAGKDEMSGTPVGAIGRFSERVSRPTAVRRLRNRRRCTRIGVCEHWKQPRSAHPHRRSRPKSCAYARCCRTAQFAPALAAAQALRRRCPRIATSVHDRGEPALSEPRSRGAGDAGTNWKALHPQLQPPVPGARSLLSCARSSATPPSRPFCAPSISMRRCQRAGAHCKSCIRMPATAPTRRSPPATSPSSPACRRSRDGQQHVRGRRNPRGRAARARSTC